VGGVERAERRLGAGFGVVKRELHGVLVGQGRGQINRLGWGGVRWVLGLGCW
jgi:hypothetical protein